ncbi:MAG: PAS domain S-box protein [Nitrospirota bacterium]|nr:PAS domain S-box protein [Nitrospirota bacterium]
MNGKASNDNVSDTGRSACGAEEHPSPSDTLETANIADLSGAYELLRQEIAERRQAEKKLKESEERYRTVVEDQTEIINRFRPDGTYTFVNDVFCRFFNKSREELVGEKWFPQAYTEDLGMIRSRLAAMSPENHVVVIENRVYSGKGDLHWMQFVNRGFYNNEGSLLEVQSVGRDITARKLAEEKLEKYQAHLEEMVAERTAGLEKANMRLMNEISERIHAEKALKQSEAKYWAVIQTSTDGFWLVDINGHILEVNEAYMRRSGYSREELIRMHVTDLEANERAEETAAHIREVMRKGSEVFESRHRAKDGSVWDVEVNVIHVPDLGGRFFSFFRDITGRKQSEQALKEALNEKETLLQEVHHRVKNNLLVLHSLISLQQAGLTGRETVNEILNTTKLRISAISKVHQLLYQSERLSEINIPEYIASVTNDITTAFDAGKRSIDISLDLEPALIGIEKAVPCGIIINELLTNAFKYAFIERDSGQISISFRKKDDGCELVIRDNGVGMPEEFVSGEARSLGLQLITLLTRQLKGKLEYKRDNGSKFMIIFQ